MKSIYLDGCSMIYGQYLPENKTLNHLFSNDGGYHVKDNSRPGKSNISIALDVHNNFKNYDIVIVGFTYSSRFGLEFDGYNLDLFAGYHGKKISSNKENAADVSESFLNLYKYFYLLSDTPYLNKLSDMIADHTMGFLYSQNKKVVGITWEGRKTINELYRPCFQPEFYLDDGHLNEGGTFKLYNIIQNFLDEQQQ